MPRIGLPKRKGCIVEAEGKGSLLRGVQNIHFFVGVALMIVIGLIPPIEPITAVGMQVLGIFVGTLYLWSTVDVLLGSIVSISALGLSSYDAMGATVASTFGNGVVLQTLFILIFVGAMVEEGISNHIGRWFLTRKITQGRPWLFLFTICIGCYLYAVFMGPLLPILLFWPVCFGIFEDVGYTKNDKFPKIMMIMIVVSCLAGFPVAPSKDNALATLTNFRNLVGDPTFIGDGVYFTIFFCIGLLFMLICLAVGKFVFRPDTEPFKKFDVTKLNADPLPPMTRRQKVLAAAFVLYALAMLVPSFFPTAPVLSFLYKNSIGLAMVFVSITSLLCIDGKPVLPLVASLKKRVDWGTVFLVAAAIEIGSVLTSEKTGIGAALSQVLSPIFSGMDFIVFAIVMMIVLMVLTNVCNSLVIALITQPVILVFAQSTGMDVAPIVALGIYFVFSCAMFTPAASPFAAVMYSSHENWLTKGDIYKYAGAYILVEFALMLLVGLPLTTLVL